MDWTGRTFNTRLILVYTKHMDMDTLSDAFSLQNPSRGRVCVKRKL